jgi:phosphomannomutase
MNGATQTGPLRSSLKYEPRELEFGTSGRRGKVVDLTQLEVYINALAELEYLQSLDTSEGGIVRGQEFFFARDLRPSSDSFVPEQDGRGEIAQAIVAAIRDAGMRAVNLGSIPTPALTCYALARGKGSIMVTGSHIPFDRNGYKTNTSKGELLKQQEAPIHEQVRKVRQSYLMSAASSRPATRIFQQNSLKPALPGSGDSPASSRAHLSKASGSWSINTPRWGETCWWRSSSA